MTDTTKWGVGLGFVVLGVLIMLGAIKVPLVALPAIVFIVMGVLILTDILRVSAIQQIRKTIKDEDVKDTKKLKELLESDKALDKTLTTTVVSDDLPKIKKFFRITEDEVRYVLDVLGLSVVGETCTPMQPIANKTYIVDSSGACILVDQEPEEPDEPEEPEEPEDPEEPEEPEEIDGTLGTGEIEGGVAEFI